MTEDEIRAALAILDRDLLELDEQAEGRALSPDQQEVFDEGLSERRRLQADLDSIVERKAEVARIASNRENREEGDGARGGAPQVMRRVQPFDGADVRTLTDREVRDRSRKVLDDETHVRHLSDAQKVQVERILRRASGDCSGAHVGRRLLLTESEAYRSAFVKLVTRQNPVLHAEEAKAVEAFDEFRAMSIGTDAAGGYGVPILIDPTIILTAQGSPNDILNIARVETITNDEWRGVTSAGVSWSFDAEAAEVSDDSPTLAQPTVPTYKAQGFIPYSIEVGMDYPNFAAEMSTLLDSGYRELLAEKLTVGSGSGEPTGIVTALDANTNVEVTPVTDGAFGAVDIYRLWDALPIRYRSRNVSWMSSTDVMNEVRQFGSGGSGGSNFSVDLTQESVPRLFGKRYYENDYMADFTSTTGAANLLVLGDFQNYLVAQRAGMNVELVPHLLGSNRRPSGQRGWYAWARVGADSINDLAFRLLQNQ